MAVEAGVEMIDPVRGAVQLVTRALDVGTAPVRELARLGSDSLLLAALLRDTDPEPDAAAKPPDGIKLGAAAARRATSPFSDLPGEHFSPAGRSPTEGSTSEGWVFRMADDSWFPGRIDDHWQWQDLAACRGTRTKVFFHSERDAARRGVAGRQQPRR